MRTYILCISISLITFSNAQIKMPSKIFKFDRFEVCNVTESSPFQFNYTYINNTNKGSLLDCSFQVHRTILKVATSTKVIRCSNKELLDSCEFFAVVNLKDTCFLLELKDGFFAEYVYATQPPFKCPFEKGQYIQNNGYFDPNKFFFFPLEKWYWKFYMTFTDMSTKEFLFQVCTEGQVFISYS